MPYLLLGVIAAAGLFASIGCHLMGWLNVEPPWGKSLSVLQLVMFIGIFAVWIPVGILADRTKPRTGRGNLGHLLAELPTWARVAAFGLFAYTLLNYAAIMISQQPWPGWRQLPFSVQLRGFSGHWMLFYGWALVGFIALARIARKRRKNGRIA